MAKKVDWEDLLPRERMRDTLEHAETGKITQRDGERAFLVDELLYVVKADLGLVLDKLDEIAAITTNYLTDDIGAKEALEKIMQILDRKRVRHNAQEDL